ncbi:MAG: DUF2892 domain-containing protein [Anaerolineales bacterium]|nr:MAG: DUF2892 domain-containing protein [Anaerolineales bacterium]
MKHGVVGLGAHNSCFFDKQEFEMGESNLDDLTKLLGWFKTCNRVSHTAMYFYFRLLSSRAGRILRIAIGICLIIVGILWDRFGGLSWLLIFPGMFTLLAAMLNLCLLAPLFGLPIVGSDLRRLEHGKRNNNDQLIDLTYVGDNLRRNSHSEKHD